MQTSLRLRFDPNQDYQVDAVNSVVRLFDGYERRETRFKLGDEIVANVAPDETLSEQWLRDNLRAVQDEHGIPYGGPLAPLDPEREIVLAGVGNETWEYPSFTVEMETGTGKTYVYLRTIHELRRLYGFGKFIIVVPSVAIFEGVAKTFEITRTHFGALYANERVNLIRYDGAQLNRLRSFATSTFCDVLVITLDAFNKATNNLYKASEKLPGERRPFQFIQETRPILILDEPQNMESQLSRSALATLHPLFSLRYSATHRRSPNLVYRLTPFDAFQRNLVKRIQVLGVTEREDFNQPFLSLKSVTKQGQIRATVATYLDDRGRTRESDVTLKQGDDLFRSTRRADHRGYVVAEINREKKFVEFENGIVLKQGEDIGPSRPELFKVQIEETVRQHLATQERLRPLGIKVLTLFFIDRVASYTAEDGLVRSLFDQTFTRLRREYEGFGALEPAQVREAYFAKRKTKDGEEVVDIALEETDQRKEEREAAKAAFSLIMRDKERLLSFEEPVSFIFAHSALKEGWDNPNVFQICTLNQTTSEAKKRQEIGRGLRLCVNQQGERVHGDEVNVLTVVANQSYQSYAAQLQQEYVEEGNAEGKPPAPTDAKRRAARRNERIFSGDPDFREFWRRLSARVRYEIQLDHRTLVEECVRRLDGADYPRPKIVVQRGDFVVHRYRFTLTSAKRDRARIKVELDTTSGDRSVTERDYREGDDLAQIHNDQRLRGFRIVEYGALPEPRAVFENAEELTPEEPRVYESTEGQRVLEQTTLVPAARYPVFNLVDRAARETGLTRASIGKIFKGLASRTKERIFANPEGFAGVFITTIRNALADEVSQSLVFSLEGTNEFDLEKWFPLEKKFPQKELLEAGERGLYDLVQKDSDVEARFIDRLKRDADVLFYFKFPPGFLVKLPRIIGSYNPDWGILRRADDGRVKLYLVRETKGSERLDTLRFPHEKRKVECAAKYFGAMGIDYRAITAATEEWWKPASGVAPQRELPIAPGRQ